MNKREVIQIFDQSDYKDYENLIDKYLSENKSWHKTLTRKYTNELERQRILFQKYDELNKYERDAFNNGKKTIAGIDEVGRGCLAGPLVVAIVVLDFSKPILGLNDSKKVTKVNRNKIYSDIIEKAFFYDTIVIDPKTVDIENIYQATKNGMQQLVEKTQFDYYLVDAMKLDTTKSHLSLIKGDTLSNSIAAASIVAKVTRDRIMDEYSLIYPEFGFELNSGYGTPKHLAVLDEFGYTQIHRKTYRPVSDHVKQKNRYITKRKV
jgi:ribonuclease HII